MWKLKCLATFDVFVHTWLKIAQLQHHSVSSTSGLSPLGRRVSVATSETGNRPQLIKKNDIFQTQNRATLSKPFRHFSGPNSDGGGQRQNKKCSRPVSSHLGDVVSTQMFHMYEGLSTSAFRKMFMIPFDFHGIMTTFRKAEVDSPPPRT